MAPTGGSRIPSDWALAQTDSLATYMVSLFNHTLHPESHDVPQIPPISLPSLCEADCVVGRLVRAYRNQICIPDIDIIRLAETIHRWRSEHHPEQALNSEEDMLPEEVSAGWLELTEPALVTDKADSVLLWYLPGAVSMPNQVCIPMSRNT
ncbi:hypothetical protein JVT61DRAFT_7103 [Boletus reticuloceps]|uniref:Uncharacterized protein n=1 Tax=Boletus reticuloceps TaxID=495285 RepID=A0A8I2YJ84_9AGAM|nr:hypothetical protein JVT61DRAFT_7103 [Boletus reticuloceps]